MEKRAIQNFFSSKSSTVLISAIGDGERQVAYLKTMTNQRVSFGHRRANFFKIGGPGRLDGLANRRRLDGFFVTSETSDGGGNANTKPGEDSHHFAGVFELADESTGTTSGDPA
jgi:hypothetical protein